MPVCVNVAIGFIPLHDLKIRGVLLPGIHAFLNELAFLPVAEPAVMDDFRDRVQMLKIQKCLFTDRVGNISVSAEIVPVPVIVILGLLCEVIEKIGAEKVEAPVEEAKTVETEATPVEEVKTEEAPKAEEPAKEEVKEDKKEEIKRRMLLPRMFPWKKKSFYCVMTDRSDKAILLQKSPAGG